MAVAAYNNGQYEWSEFQLSLIESIRHWEQGGRDPDAEPLETVLAGSGLLSESMLDERTKEVLATRATPATSTPTAIRSQSTPRCADPVRTGGAPASSGACPAVFR